MDLHLKILQWEKSKPKAEGTWCRRKWGEGGLEEYPDWKNNQLGCFHMVSAALFLPSFKGAEAEGGYNLTLVTGGIQAEARWLFTGKTGVGIWTPRILWHWVQGLSTMVMGQVRLPRNPGERCPLSQLLYMQTTLLQCALLLWWPHHSSS